MENSLGRLVIKWNTVNSCMVLVRETKTMASRDFLETREAANGCCYQTILFECWRIDKDQVMLNTFVSERNEVSPSSVLKVQRNYQKAEQPRYSTIPAGLSAF